MTDLSFSFHRDEKPRAGFFRVLKEIATRAQAIAGDQKASEDPVHEARVLIKRTRALLWFARPAMAANLYERTKEKLRRAAGMLSGHRDITVAQATLEKIGRKAQADDRNAVQETLEKFKEKAPAPTEAGESLPKAMQMLVRLIAAIKIPTNAKWPQTSDRVDKAFRAERKAARKARKSEADPDIHEWRKKAKRLFYELELAQGKGASHKKRVLKNADELQDRLGKHQDCVVVEQHLQETPSLAASAARVVEIIRTRKEALRKKSRKLARRLKSDL